MPIVEDNVKYRWLNFFAQKGMSKSMQKWVKGKAMMSKEDIQSVESAWWSSARVKPKQVVSTLALGAMLHQLFLPL